MANREKNKKILLELAKQPENSRCADCGAPDPDWASYKLGVFVCLNCSGIHRNLSSRVKSIKLDFWEDDLVEFMKSHGNASAQALYEKAVPPYYYRPQQDDCAFLKEQWIRAKYERTEFTGENKYPPISYTTGFYEGMLWKKGKDNMQFLKRKFVLSERDFTLIYYNKDNESKGPKAVVSIKDVNATFQAEKISHAHGLQLTHLTEDDHTRSLYVYHESPEEIVTWFNAIRATRYAYLKTAYPNGSDEELIPKITRKYLKEGFMEKTGPLVRSHGGFTVVNVGSRGFGGHFHWHHRPRLLCERLGAKERSGKQVDVVLGSADPRETVCLHVRAGEGAEGVDGRHRRGSVQAHGTAGLHH
ncbi:arf-GAP with dual PH domain-containing protein 2 isoform X2 [Genypterus blacodes]|uniref:arf-GAP with dual PH domain-containing protein 2 isoform X2 n=1 Tax=Genypterus blacodes TaxID=154954 RepID=UPI003F7738B4